jgi:hypothetical protein
MIIAQGKRCTSAALGKRAQKIISLSPLAAPKSAKAGGGERGFSV